MSPPPRLPVTVLSGFLGAGKTTLLSILNTGRFDFDHASASEQWLAVPRGQEVPETEEYGIGNFVWRADLAFHPQRFWDFLNEDWPGLLRSKGYFFLAKDPTLAWTWSQAGQTGEPVAIGHWSDAAKQELVFIGQSLDRPAMEAALLAALATSAELKAGFKLANPFPEPESFGEGHSAS